MLTRRVGSLSQRNHFYQTMHTAGKPVLLAYRIHRRLTEYGIPLTTGFTPIVHPAKDDVEFPELYSIGMVSQNLDFC